MVCENDRNKNEKSRKRICKEAMVEVKESSSGHTDLLKQTAEVGQSEGCLLSLSSRCLHIGMALPSEPSPDTHKPDSVRE